MKFLPKSLVKVCERFLRLGRGQTVTDYALGLLAMAVTAYMAYRLLGDSIGIPVPP